MFVFCIVILGQLFRCWKLLVVVCVGVVGFGYVFYVVFFFDGVVMVLCGVYDFVGEVFDGGVFGVIVYGVDYLVQGQVLLMVGVDFDGYLVG